MSKVTVSKLQIAQAKQCADRLDKYSDMLRIIIELLGFAKAQMSYNKLPVEFLTMHKRDLDTVKWDLIAMRKDAQEQMLHKLDRAKELEETRQRQLEGK